MAVPRQTFRHAARISYPGKKSEAPSVTARGWLVGVPQVMRHARRDAYRVLSESRISRSSRMSSGVAAGAASAGLRMRL